MSLNKDILKKYYDRLVADPMKVISMSSYGNFGHLNSDRLSWKTFEAAIICGSFNPLHLAHKYIFSHVKDHLTLWNEVFFEISIRRVGKADLTVEELEQRLEQFLGFAPVIITNAPTYLEKITTIPFQCSFHAGADTLKRLLETYGPYGLQSIPTCFWVYDRSGPDGVVHTADSVLRTFGNFVPWNVRRVETPNKPIELYGLSSTKIREAASHVRT